MDVHQNARLTPRCRELLVARVRAGRRRAEVARELGVSEPTVRNRVTRLLKGGAILPWARVNPAAIGFPVDAMLGIRVRQGCSMLVGAKLAEMDNVAYVAYTTGSFDILIEAHLPDNEGLFKFLNEDLEHIDGIVYKETWHVLRTEKTNFEWEGENVGQAPLHELAGAAAMTNDTEGRV